MVLPCIGRASLEEASSSNCKRVDRVASLPLTLRDFVFADAALAEPDPLLVARPLNLTDRTEMATAIAQSTYWLTHTLASQELGHVRQGNRDMPVMRRASDPGIYGMFLDPLIFPEPIFVVVRLGRTELIQPRCLTSLCPFIGKGKLPAGFHVSLHEC